MKNFLIVEVATLAIVCKYKAEAQAEYGGAWAVSELFAHLEVPEEMDVDCVVVSLEDDEMVVSEDAGLLAAKAQENIRRQLMAAKSFGNKVIEDFTLENMVMGITQDGMTGSVRKATAEVISALGTGSLYDAMDELRAIPVEKKDPKYITDARLLQAVNKIEEFLGLEPSEEL